MPLHLPEVPNPQRDGAEPMPLGRLQGALGLAIGGITYMALIINDPFGVVTVRIPERVDPVEVAEAMTQWRCSIGVIAGTFAMTLLPLLAAGTLGVFVHWSRPSSIPNALVRMTVVASILLAVSSAGSWAIDRLLSTGESSDIGTPLAVLAFQALCIALAAPLSSATVRRRQRPAGQQDPEVLREPPETGS